MDFLVNLIKAPKLEQMSSKEVFDLMRNATHVRGEYWIFEGNFESLMAPVTVVAEGITSGTGDMEDDELVRHCQDIFGIDLHKEKRSWEMIVR